MGLLFFLAQLFVFELPSKVPVDQRSQASSQAAMSHRPTPPQEAPPALAVLRQTAEDLPALVEMERKLMMKVEVWQENLVAAQQELAACQCKLAKKRAHADAALAHIKAADKEEEEKKKKLAAELPAARPSKAPRLG